MEFTFEQCNFLDRPLRLFLMGARRSGLSVDVLHMYHNGSASMRVRQASPLMDITRSCVGRDDAGVMKPITYCVRHVAVRSGRMTYRLSAYPKSTSLLLVGLVALGLGACSSAASGTNASEAPQSTTETGVTTVSPSTAATPTTSPTTAVATTAETATTEAQVRDHYERPCESLIGRGYGAPGSDIPILHVGPVALLAFDPEWLEANRYYMEPTSDGRYEGVKFVLVIDHTAVGPVTVSLSDTDRDHVRLAYDPERFRSLTWEQTDHTVKFRVCSEVDAQYNGGFVVNAPTCARIVVIDEGVDGSEWSAAIPFGVPADACETAG